MNSNEQRNSEWYIPLTMLVSVAGGILAVNQIISPVLTGIIDINIKLTRLESQSQRITELEERTDRLEHKVYKK